MKFIIDGDGAVSYRAAYDLLKDIVTPYGSRVMAITGLIMGPLSPNITKALGALEDASVITWNQVPSVMDEFEIPGNKIYIVANPGTRVEKVTYCKDHQIPVLDLEKGLYPV